MKDYRRDVTKSDVLKKINELGWSDLIDSRWKQKLLGDIYDNFPNVSVYVVEEVLKLVLV
jgi:hypothetical protein